MSTSNFPQLKPASLKLSDEELIKYYLITQQSTYFNQLYIKYSEKIYTKCLYLLGEEVPAEDAMQDIFIKIFSNLYKFEHKSKFSTWVYSITYNYCIDLIRKKKKERRVFLDENEQVYHFDNIEDTTFLETKVAHLNAVLESIPVKDKKVLLMKYQNEMPIKEIAKTLNKTESAIKMRIKRAKNKAKNIYSDRFKSGIYTLNPTLEYTTATETNSRCPFHKRIPTNQ